MREAAARALLVLALLVAPVPAAAHNPGAAFLSMVLLGAVASLLSLPARWFLVRRWSGARPRMGPVAALGAAEILVTIGLLFMLFSFGEVAGVAGALASVLVLAALHRALLPASELWRVVILGLAWPATFLALYALAYWPLYVLLGG